MRKFIAVLLVFLLVTVIVLSFGELQNILDTLKHATLRYIFLALIIFALWLWNIGLTYRSIYHLLGIDESRERLTLLAAASAFVNIVAPTAGWGGVALFASDARARGRPPGKATLAGALFLLVDQVAFLSVLSIGWIVLIRRNDLDPGEIFASLIMLAVALVTAFLLYLGYRSQAELGNALARIARAINRLLHIFLRRDYLSEERAYSFAAEVGEGLADLPGHSLQRLMRPLFHALLNKAFLISILLCSFLAFNVPFSAGTIIAGWAIGYLFLVVSPTPNGIGVVEGLMPVTLTSLRVPYEAAVVVTLVYRAITFWVMLGVGAWAFRRLQLTPAPEAA